MPQRHYTFTSIHAFPSLATLPDGRQLQYSFFKSKQQSLVQNDQSHQLVTGNILVVPCVQVQIPFYHVEAVWYGKSPEAQISSTWFGGEFVREEYQVECLPRHLTIARKYNVIF
ncbi:hypothetical protein TNCV_232821 [Trichonephila clavipes]|nr:hypothetical protein TNCV_232821 [Trichonephila clavipes]